MLALGIADFESPATFELVEFSPDFLGPTLSSCACLTRAEGRETLPP